jgi:hypothetical protein
MVIGFVVGSVLFTGVSGLVLALRLGHESWICCPEATAMIRSASVWSTDHENCSHVGYIIYSYQVDTDAYSVFYEKSFATRRGALQFLEEFRFLPLVVRYRPEHPEESCLLVDSGAMPESTAALILSVGGARD